MRLFARTSLGFLCSALIAPITAGAQDVSPSSPAGYQPEASASSLARDAVPAPVPYAAPLGPTASLCPPPRRNSHTSIRAGSSAPKCAAKQAALQANAMPPGTIVGCEHSKNGVCSRCAALLKRPASS